MKIAVISDIHANKLALDKVLEDIESLQCDEIWCLGDIAMAGYDPNYAIEKIKSLMSPESSVKTRCICGNTDLMIANFNEEYLKKVIAHAPEMGYALEDDVKIIKKENVKFLKSLPQNETVEVLGSKFFLCHGSPRQIDEGIYPDTQAPVLQEIVSSIDADIILCGHTHIPCGFQLDNGQSVVNVGSVGRSMTQDRKAVWFYLNVSEKEGPCRFQMMHKFVEYDNKAAAEKILERGFKDCDKLADMLLKKE